MDNLITTNLQIGGGYYSELVLKPADLLDLLGKAIEYGEVIIRISPEVVQNAE